MTTDRLDGGCAQIGSGVGPESWPATWNGGTAETTRGNPGTVGGGVHVRFSPAGRPIGSVDLLAGAEDSEGNRCRTDLNGNVTILEGY